MKAYVFLDLDHPPVAWAVMRGLLVSAKYAHEQGSHPGFISFMLAGMIEFQNNPRIFNESVIERVRASSFSHRTSRLAGMYFFLSEADALARVADPEWPPYFKRENLVEVDLHTETPPTVVDANWITYVPRNKDRLIDSNDVAYWSKYWAGEPYNITPVWELIAEGVAIIPSEAVRRRCFDQLKKEFPEAEIPILMARLAGGVGSRGGMISPFLLSQPDDVTQLAYIWNEGDFQRDGVIQAMSNHPDFEYLVGLMSRHETWTKPDFRAYFRNFKRSQMECDVGMEKMIYLYVHHNSNEPALSAFPE